MIAVWQTLTVVDAYACSVKRGFPIAWRGSVPFPSDKVTLAVGSTMLLPRQDAHVPADSRGVSPQHARCSPPTRHVPGIGSSAEGGESELALSLECRQVRVRDGLVWKRFTRRR